MDPEITNNNNKLNIQDVKKILINHMVNLL